MGRGTSATRPSLVRWQRIVDRIRKGDAPNARTLARELECSPRTVQRDLEVLRDQLGARVEFDARRNGYRLLDDGFELPRARMTAAELAAFLIAERALGALGPGPLAKVLHEAREKLAQALPPEMRLGLDDRAALVDFRGALPAEVSERTFALLTRAVAERRRLRIRYRTATRGGAQSERRIDPYALVTQDGLLYVLAHCHRRRRVLAFAANRVDEITETGERFARPEGFSADAHLRGAFRVFVGSKLVAVRVRFSPQAAVYLRERPWHASQRLEERRDGSVVARFEVSWPEELLRWVLSWGAQAEVLGPAPVRARARAMLAEALRAYEKSSGTPGVRQRMSHPPRTVAARSTRVKRARREAPVGGTRARGAEGR